MNPNPTPFGPNAIEIASPIANALVRYALDHSSIPHLELASVKGLFDQDGALHETTGSLRVTETGELSVIVDGHHPSRDEAKKTEQVVLTDETIVRADHARLVRNSTEVSNGRGRRTTELAFREWSWATGAPMVAWVGTLRGAELGRLHNLAVQKEGNSRSDCLRVAGNGTWHLVPTKGGERACLVVVEVEGDIDRSELWHDFAALEFLLGHPLRLDFLVGIDAQNSPVAFYGASFGYRYGASAVSAPPLPEDHLHAWPAAAMPLLARRLNEESRVLSQEGRGAKRPITKGICGYVDSMTGHIDGQYLFAQIALEATAASLVKQPKPIVADESAWKNWRRETRVDYHALAADERGKRILDTKLRDASRPTTSTIVEDTFAELGMVVPTEALDEIERRNGVAHTFSMTDDEDYDIERDVRRIRMIRTLLAALILRSSGYNGALANWDHPLHRGPGPVDWFIESAETRDIARRRYHAQSTMR